ncbi:MAG: hypothetical protein QG614_298 [Patescibacteria group bacterium]|nr:hypothetical protein [Patescibacteria group bacterium]
MNKIAKILLGILGLIVIMFLVKIINTEPEVTKDTLNYSNINQNNSTSTEASSQTNLQNNLQNNTNNITFTNNKTKTGMRDIIIKTNKGDIELQLNGDRTPLTVNNFITLAEAGFYNGTKFHRVIKDFMIQGGDPLSKDDSKKNYWGMGGPDYKFEDEVFSDDNMVEGDIAMANSGPNTNGSQFFIVTAEATPWLNGKHTIFGKVTKGMDIVKSIEASNTDNTDKPLEAITVSEVVIVK